MGLDAYRFSISWPRLLPHGKLSGGVNEEGVQYYNNLINELLKKGVEPFVTLFHWDLPQALEDDYGGFLSPRILKDFGDYADLCFKRFGDRVKYWVTFNEPYSYAIGGYVTGEYAPGRCSSWQNLNCSGGDSGVEPYVVAHHQLLAHATVAKLLYKKRYQESQKGQIGITLVARWMIPWSEESVHRAAARGALDFSLGWYMEALTEGDYPESMKSGARARVPVFTEDERELVKGPFDFIGLNYYTTYYVRNFPNTNSSKTSYLTDSQTRITPERNGVPVGHKGASNWLYVYPRGIRNVLLYVKKTYNNPTIYITENGIDEINNSTLSLQEALVDTMRIEFYYRHLSYLRKAIEKGVDVRGFFAWALLDNFEWNSGYSLRFGLNYVDYEDGLKRYPKLSARWFKNFLQH